MQVTNDIGLAYDFAKHRASAAFTAEELAAGANIKLAAAQRVAMLLSELRIFDCIANHRPRHYCLMDPPLSENGPRIAEIEKILRLIILPKLRTAAQESQNIRASEPSAYDPYTPQADRRAEPRKGNDSPPNGGSAEGGPAAPKPKPPEGPGAANQNVGNAASEVGGSGPTDADAGGAPSTRGRIDKTKLLFDMIRRPEGATLDELATALGNQPHSVRASISVKSRELGLKVECENGRYFIATAA